MTRNTKDNQRLFSPLDDAGKEKATKREVFQALMAAVVPWHKLEAVIDPHDPKMGSQGRRRAEICLSLFRIRPKSNSL